MCARTFVYMCTMYVCEKITWFMYTYCVCRFVGPYTQLSPELSFVVEDSEGVCGYILAALDSRSFYDQFKEEWLPTIIDNYPGPLPKTKGEKISPEEVRKKDDVCFILTCSFHPFTFPIHDRS